MKTFLSVLIILSIIVSCGPVKKAQRKARRADRLLKEAGMLAPQLMDTIYIEKIDTMYLNKDSIVFKTNLLLDTVEVDRIIEKLIEVKQEGGDIGALKQEIYEELLPDLNYTSRDSLKISIDDEVHYVRFDATVKIINDVLEVTVKPVDNVPFVSVTKEINIDAVRKRWYQDWTFWLLAAIVAAFMVFKEAIITWIKKF